jgi:cytochrome c oxidase assembly protein subunit 15
MLAVVTFPLVWWGGFVTATGSGMAFRDWLTSDGHFMLWYPWLSSSGDKFIEHGHRLLGALAGMLTIAVVVAAFRCDTRGGVRKYSLWLLAGVVAQGVLGGLRVVLDRRTLALVHGCTGPAFFAAAVGMVVVTSRWWRAAATENRHQAIAARRTLRLALICTGLAYLQLMLGACLRHGRLLTSEASAIVFQTAVYLHVAVAVLVVGHLLLLTVKCFRCRIERVLAAALALLVAGQFLLGVASWLAMYGQPHWVAQRWGEWNFVNVEAGMLRAGIVTTHGAIGSLIVALCLATALRLARRGKVAVRRTSVRKVSLQGATA